MVDAQMEAVKAVVKEIYNHACLSDYVDYPVTIWVVSEEPLVLAMGPRDGRATRRATGDAVAFYNVGYLPRRLREIAPILERSVRKLAALWRYRCRHNVPALGETP